MPSKSAWITGGDSFTGRYLVPKLESKGYQVTSLTRTVGDPSRERALELSDPASIQTCFDGAEIDLFVHLAAISFVGHSDQSEIYRVNTVGTELLLKALSKLDNPPKSIIASSANVYGNPLRLPCAESDAPRPENHYAVSKYGLEQVCRWYQPHLDIVVARPFNYTGVGQRREFLIPKLVAAFSEAEPRVELGNLDVARDFLDVRDVADAYISLAERGVPGEIYNIASGAAVEIGEVIAMLEEISGKSLAIHQNPDFMRANELKVLLGDNTKLCQLGWSHNHILGDTLAWMLAG